jgi:hypothetical protein
MVEVRYKDGRSASQRVTDRLNPSNTRTPRASTGVVNVRTQQGHGPRRVVSTHHHSGAQGHHTDQGSQSISDMPIVATGGRILGQRGED